MTLGWGKNAYQKVLEGVGLYHSWQSACPSTPETLGLILALHTPGKIEFAYNPAGESKRITSSVILSHTKSSRPTLSYKTPFKSKIFPQSQRGRQVNA